MANMLSESMTFTQANALLEGGGINADGKQKDLYMRGIFIQGGVRNHNRRVYPVHEIRRAVEAVNERFSSGQSILGEADHPAELNINIDRVSHMITELYMDGPNGIGKLKIIPTPLGNTVRILLESGVKLGVSSRGSGDVDENGEVSNFEIVTVDIVANPSAPAAYPKAVYEAFNMRNGTEIHKLAEAVSHDAAAQKYLKNELMSFINSLK